MADAYSPSPLTPADQAALANAVEALEKVSFSARAMTALGRHVGATAARFVPARISGAVSKAAGAALKAAMHVALTSLRNRPPKDSRAFHRTLATASGAAGGAFGLASLPVELPISTTVMLRSIADIARSEGEDLSNPEAALACMQVFALGGHSSADDMMEEGYFAIRGVLAQSVSEAARHIAHKGAIDEAAPVIVRLLGQIAGRFGVVVSEKLAAQAVPLIGAAGGAAINLAFINHFQSVAKGHFAVRRLERRYSPDVVRREYERIAIENGIRVKRQKATADV